MSSLFTLHYVKVPNTFCWLLLSLSSCYKRRYWLRFTTVVTSLFVLFLIIILHYWNFLQQSIKLFPFCVQFGPYLSLCLICLKLLCLVITAFSLSFYVQYSSISFWLRCVIPDLWWTSLLYLLPLSAFLGYRGQTKVNPHLESCYSIIVEMIC